MHRGRVRACACMSARARLCSFEFNLYGRARRWLDFTVKFSHALFVATNGVLGKIARELSEASSGVKQTVPLFPSQAWKLGMHGGDYAWILPVDTIDLTSDWWETGVGECSPSQLSQTLDGLIIVKSHAAVVEDEASTSGLVCCSFAVRARRTFASTDDAGACACRSKATQNINISRTREVN